MNYLVFLAFRGTAYHGFQVQKNGLTVSEVFQNALQKTLGARPDIKGCSRTDAGVHALRFAVSFCGDTAIPPEKLPLALNAHLPGDVRVLSAKIVPGDFHARYSAHQKTYLYRILNSAIDSPFEPDTIYRAATPAPLNETAMQAAAQHFVGKHDFLALCSAGSAVAEKGDTVRTVTRCDVARSGEIVSITVSADGYLYNMVRILAGTLFQVGAGRLNPGDIPGILQGRDRSAAGPTLPAKGLFLTDVEY